MQTKDLWFGGDGVVADEIKALLEGVAVERSVDA
jgi:hypothetical protein